MDAQQTFLRFIERVLTPNKADRFASLMATRKGRQRILKSLCHEFESAILPTALRRTYDDALWSRPCFVFYEPIGFGVEFDTLRAAYQQLSIEDSWLIVLLDASAGIYRPEGRWDNEKFIIA